MSAAKLVLGVILIIIALYVIWKYTLHETWIVIQGIIPPIVLILGIFIVWLEMDEMKTQKELSKGKKK